MDVELELQVLPLLSISSLLLKASCISRFLFFLASSRAVLSYMESMLTSVLSQPRRALIAPILPASDAVCSGVLFQLSTLFTSVD